jgi:cytochrome c556
MVKNTVFAGCVGALLIGAMMLQPISAQNAPAQDMTALTSQVETTVARRLLMVSIGRHNDIIHDILDGVLPDDEAELRARLFSISAMLYAFPSLYRAEANPYTEEGATADAARVSLSTMSAWENFEAFRALSMDGYNKAQEAADAPSEDILARVEELETICESCHTAYRQPFDYLDYDRIEDFILQ